MTSFTDPRGNSRELTFDPAGRLVEIADARGTAHFISDELGRLVSFTDMAGQVKISEYDATGNHTVEIDALGNRKVNSYDAIGRIIATIDESGGVWTYGYCAELGGGTNAGASFCEVTDSLGRTVQIDHDILGRPVRTTDPMGHATEVEYDSRGSILARTNALGRADRYEYDGVGRLTAVIEANGARTKYFYDKSGNLIKVRDAEQKEWVKSYDALNRPVTDVDPLGNMTIFTYDALGNLESTLDPNGDLITYSYDLDKVASIELPGGVAEAFAYDVSGRRVEMMSAEASQTYAYDSMSRLLETTDNALGQTIDYSYDDKGRLTHAVTPQSTVQYFYDAAGRLVEQEDSLAGTYRYAYDQVGRRTALVLPNGLVTEYTYDDADRLESILVRDPQGDLVDGYSYGYDAVANQTSMTELRSGVTHTYNYDETNRLTRWQRGTDRFEEYDYDQVGNRSILRDERGSIVYHYDPADRLLSELREWNAGGSSTTTYTWDNKGNMLSRQMSSVTTTYSYDPRNRLVETTGPNGAYSYGYNGDGIRVRETGPAGTRRFLHDREDVVGIYDSAGIVEAYYSHGPGVDEPLAQVTAEAVHYFHHDALGSVTSLSATDGRLRGAVSYAPFGGVEDASGVTSTYGYASRELDPTGLMYYRARFYQPDSGRFIQADPFPGFLSVPASMQDYVYVRNNPVTGTDPSGLSDEQDANLGTLLAEGMILIAQLVELAWIIGALLKYTIVYHGLVLIVVWITVLVAIFLYMTDYMTTGHFLLELGLLALAALLVHWLFPLGSTLSYVVYIVAGALLIYAVSINHVLVKEYWSEAFDNFREGVQGKKDEVERKVAPHVQ